jgi:hypothetical protein
MGMLWQYSATPSAAASPSAFWPRESAIKPAPDRATLVMLAHPHCPCTRASLSELARLVTRLPTELAVHVLFVKPSGVAKDWESTDIFRAATTIPGADVHIDEQGREAALFHAATSGETVVYGRDGHLLFHGGITGSRGHEGDNPGRDRIIALLTTGSADEAESDVFGCSLLGTEGM